MFCTRRVEQGASRRQSLCRLVPCHIYKPDGYPASLGFPIMYQGHAKHPVHNCHHIKSCHPPVKQYTTTHHTPSLYSRTLFFICDTEVSRARAALWVVLCAVYCILYTVYCILASVLQSITFEASDRSRSLPLALIHILASELSLAPIREIAR